jgi:hypothetical protein
MRLSYFAHASVTRLYEGTDTRCQDILVGAALAIGMAIWAQHRAPVPERAGRRRRAVPKPWFGAPATPISAWEITSPLTRACLQALGWSALAGCLYLWTRVTTSVPALLKGGYLLFALAVAAVIFSVVTAQAGSLSRALGNPLFRYIGKISYGTYLWHVPIFLLLDAARLHLYGLPLLAVRIGATLVVATGSFYLVEQPIRRGRMRSITEWKAWLMTSAAFLGVVAITVASTVPSAGTAGAAGIPTPTGSEYTGPPVVATMVGDSLAFTAGWAIAGTDAQVPYDVRFHSEGLLGCGVMVVSGQISQGVEYPANKPCNASSPVSQQWPALWRGFVGAQHPDVVMVLAGRWEVSNQVIDGRDVHIGGPGYDAMLEADLQQAVGIASSAGAYVMLLTTPCEDSGEQPDGQPWPEDSASRRLEYDHLLGEVAADHPGNVEVYDFGADVCPGGKFESTIDGVRIRLGDGVHFPYQPGADGSVVPTAKWLAWKLLPEAVRVGRLQMAGVPLR